ncbi:unnamed protein product [Haemonchus placei]|uniref:Aminopeptidase n=1 Tax=Haemonchus placei TaxID=6290 RepID=A0A158QLV8_HAEPC|nr:unnamed protein product [Haemonchus placei]
MASIVPILFSQQVDMSYDLSIKTYLPGYVNFPPEKNLTFDGHVEISMVVVEPTNSIVLNSKKITLAQGGCELFSVGSINFIILFEKLSIPIHTTFRSLTPALLATLSVGSTSPSIPIRTEPPSTYNGMYTGKSTFDFRIVAVSQNEPSDARRIAPCFDEPKYKAKWTVTVVHPKGTKAASNGIEGDWITSKFKTTPPMSSYLLAIIVCEFEYIEGYTETGVRFRIWSRPEAMEMTEYALDAGIRCLEFYEKFFDIKFPLEKQDMIALPDFTAGAMENWGLITYREDSLLYDSRIYAPMNKQRVALVVAHELAHQWFGNLVTLKWWDDTWLNEGFATFVEYLGMDEISHNNFRTQDFFLLDGMDRGMRADSAASSHPLSFRIDKAAEVAEAFDDISYAKGASVLTMLRALIGEDNYRNQYLKKFSYSNAQAADLWNVFNEVVKGVKGPDGNIMKIDQFTDQWTYQMGYPVVKVEEFNATSLKVTQSRYKTNKDALEPEKYRNPKYGFKWDVPLWYQEGNSKEVKRTWLKRDEPLYLNVNKRDTSLVVNADRHGFYRQNYDASGWKKIIKQLKENHEVFGPRTRNAIISDAFAAATIDAIDYETVFELLEYAKNEEVALSGMFAVLKFFGNEPETKPARVSLNFQAYMMSILEPMYNKSSIDYIVKNYLDDTLFTKILVRYQLSDSGVMEALVGLGGYLTQNENDLISLSSWRLTFGGFYGWQILVHFYSLEIIVA